MFTDDDDDDDDDMQATAANLLGGKYQTVVRIYFFFPFLQFSLQSSSVIVW